MSNLESKIRKLARSSYYQNIYTASKECYGIKLFENDSNFSGKQSLFLYWLKVYNFLYDLQAQKEYPSLQDYVIENDIRCDAFLYWHKIEQNKKLNERNRENKKANKKRDKNYESFPIYKGAKNKGD